MPGIVVDSSPDWLWFQLVEESRQALSIRVPDEVLVYTLHVLHDGVSPDFMSGEPLSMQYATLRQQDTQKQCIYLPRLANEALLLAGLYPEQAFKRGVDPTYFQHMGMRMYSDVSICCLWKDRQRCELYNDMAVHFSRLVQLLFYLRCLQEGDYRPQPQLSGHCYHAYDAVYACLR
jgi:hypothetical protein